VSAGSATVAIGPGSAARLRWQRRAIRAGIVLGIAGALIGFWAIIWDQTDFLPSPAATWDVGVDLLGRSGTFDDIFATVRRLVVGLAIGYGAAVIVSLIMNQSRWWNGFFTPYVFTMLTIPSLATALISLMIFGLSEVGVYLAVAGVIFPFATVGLLEGLSNMDGRLNEMTMVYRWGRWERIRHQLLPQMAPFMFAAFRNVHALAWKIVVIAELFSQQNGIGFQYKRSYEFFELERLIVWGIFFVTLVMLVEYALLRPFEAYVFRWQRAER